MQQKFGELWKDERNKLVAIEIDALSSAWMHAEDIKNKKNKK